MERLESVGGLALAGEIARLSGLLDIESGPKAQSLTGMFALLVQGRTAYEDIELFRNSDLFREAMKLSYVPASETLRLYIGQLARKESLPDRIRTCNTTLLRRIRPTPVAGCANSYIPVDVDVATLDNSKSHKEGVSRTYMGTDGYAPIFSYIGAEGYMLDHELRPGSQHSQKDTPAFLVRNIATLKTLSLQHPVLFRLDSGNDAIDTIRPIVESGHYILIKRNLRRENREEWLNDAQVFGEKKDERDGKTVWTGTITKHHPKADPEMPELDIVFQVTLRTKDHEGNDLLVPDIAVETWWTNLFESPEDCINLYHDHGTSEQFHSELKSDMGVERLPSGKLRVNKVILALAMLAFNTLRLIGQSALGHKALLPVKTDVVRSRLRTVIQNLIHVGCKLIRHGRSWVLKISTKNPWLSIFTRLYNDLLSA